MPRLLIVDRNQRIELGELTTIGRDPSSNIVIDDALIALHHAEIRRDAGGGFRAVDLGSRRGTFLGGKRISDAALADGDELLIGATRLRIELPEGEETSALPGEQASSEENYLPVAEVKDESRLRRDYEKLRIAFELARALADADDLQAVLRAALDTSIKQLRGDRGLVVLLHPVTLQPIHQATLQRDPDDAPFSLSTSLLSEVIRRREGLIRVDTGPDSDWSRSASLNLQQLRSALCMPVLHRGQLLGAILIGSRAAATFVQADMELLGMIAIEVAPALERALLAERVHDVVSEEGVRLSRLVSDLPDGVMLLDYSRSIALLNRRAKGLLAALGEDDRIGRKVDRIGGISIDQLLERSNADVLTSSSGKRVMALRASWLSMPERSELLVLMRDVTEERQREARSAQQERLALIGQLAGGMAHDFNNVLTVIANFAEFVRESVEEPEVQNDVIQIEKAALRASELVRQLLSIGRAEIVKPKVVTVEQVCEGVQKMLSGVVGPLVRIEQKLAQPSWRVRFDPSRLEQVILNLALNARDAMPVGGVLQMRTEMVELVAGGGDLMGLKPGRYVVLAVSDTGTGMPPEVQAKVFEPFFTTKGRGKGSGLGLAMVYGIVTQAGGTVTVQSEVGSGTEFRVFIPATDDLPEESAARVTVAAGGSETVLVVEDEVSVRELVRRLLSTAGYRVLDAADGAGALLLLEPEVKLDLLVTDLVLSGMSGKELARRVRERSPETRVLYMSGFFETAADAFSEGVAFLAKPFGRDELLSQVRGALDG